MSVDGNDSTLFVDSGGSAVDGAVFATHGFPEEGSPLAKFLADFETVTGAAAESKTFEAIGRDNVYALVQAAMNAGSVEPDAMIEGIKALKDFPALTGTMTMNPDTRIPEKDVTLVKMAGATRAPRSAHAGLHPGAVTTTTAAGGAPRGAAGEPPRDREPVRPLRRARRRARRLHARRGRRDRHRPRRQRGGQVVAAGAVVGLVPPASGRIVFDGATISGWRRSASCATGSRCRRRAAGSSRG